MLRNNKNAGRYCVVVGGLNFDIQAFCHDDYIAGDSNPGSVTRSLGGVGRNIAENLVRLGIHTEMLTALGDSPAWRSLIMRTTRMDIGLGHSPTLSGMPLPTYLCILEKNGSLVGAVSDMRAMDQLRVEHLEAQSSLLDGAAAIVVDGNIPQACIEWIADRYRADGNVRDHLRRRSLSVPEERPLLVADPVSVTKARKFAHCFGSFDIAKPNIAEAASIAGLEPDEAMDTTIAALRGARTLPKELYVSMGSGGIEAIGDSEVHVSLPPEELQPLTINRSGAGDASCAALLWASLSLNVGLADKAKFALSAALITTSSKNPVNPALSEDSLCKNAAKWYPELGEIVKEILNGGEI